ncbi:hypothetical protein TNCV_998281 [Trichonephila clavipes]|nr:hypothetical protein TNCV_998281 [Trichonephila clavipes]
MIVMSATNKPMTSAQNCTNELLSSCNVSVSAQTVRNVLHGAGLKAKTPRKKPYISEWSVVVQWVPNQVEILGNEKVDQKAKQGAESSQLEVPLTLRKVMSMITVQIHTNVMPRHKEPRETMVIVTSR